MSCTDCNGDCPLDLREMAVICGVCIHRRNRTNDRGVKVSFCSVDGVAIRDRKTCPRGKFSEGTGITRFAGMAVYRVPKLTRWLAWALLPSHPKPGRWKSCGCMVVLKDWWTSLA